MKTAFFNGVDAVGNTDTIESVYAAGAVAEFAIRNGLRHSRHEV